MKFYLSGKRISKKELVEKIGAERVKEMIAEAKEAYKADPNEEISWFIGVGVLSVEMH